MTSKDTNKKKFSWSYAAAFVVAIISISKFFGSYTYFQAYEDIKGLVVVALSLGCFVVAMGFMAYRIYTEEKRKDNLRSRFFFFDWIEMKLKGVRA